MGNGTEKVKEPKQIAPVELEKISSMFNLQSKLAKLKISIPFNQLLRNQEYKKTITKIIRNQGESHPDIL